MIWNSYKNDFVSLCIHAYCEVTHELQFFGYHNDDQLLSKNSVVINFF